jgi:hypothetical protein
MASSSPPEKAETTIPQGVPCSRLANLILAPSPERQRIAAYIPRWGIQLAAHLSESTAWAIYRDRLKRFGSLIGDREPVVLHKEIGDDPWRFGKIRDLLPDSNRLSKYPLEC